MFLEKGSKGSGRCSGGRKGREKQWERKLSVKRKKRRPIFRAAGLLFLMFTTKAAFCSYLEMSALCGALPFG